MKCALKILAVFWGWAWLNAAASDQQPGTKLWEFTAAGRVSSSPALGTDGTIYFGAGIYLYALNPDGSPKWRFATAGQIYSSPAVGQDGTIYFGCFDRKLYALKPTGTAKWTFTTQDRIYSSPAIALDGTIYVGSDDYSLYAINPDGTPKWMFTTGGYVRSSPSISADGTIYFGSWDNQFYAVNRNGQQLWAFEASHYVYSSPAIGADGTIYFGAVDKNLYALNPDGTKKWAFPTLSHVYSSPAIGADGTIYVGSWDNRLYAITPAGVQKWAFATGNLVQSSPAIAADGAIYFGSDENKLYAVTADGVKKWAFTCDSLVRSSPLIGPDGMIFIGTEDNKLLAINGKSGLAVTPWPMFRGDPKHNAKVLMVITRQPQSRMATVNTAVSFDVAAAGAGLLHYQWQLNGTNLLGATSTNLVLSNIQPAQAGEYSVVVSNGVEKLSSSPAILRVVVAPVIILQPQPQTVTVGASAMFRTAANSVGPLTYQWEFNGTNLPGEIAPNLVLNDVRLAQSGAYAARVSNAAGSVLSSNAVLRVVAPPQITEQPDNQVGAVGTNISFRVGASSVTPLSYQWRFNNTNLPGATAANLTLNNIQPPNAGYYCVVVSNIAGTAASHTVTLTVTLPPIITAQPKSQVGITGKSVTLAVNALSAGPLAYQWRWNDQDLVGANSNSLSLNNLQWTNTGQYCVVVSNVAGVVTSAMANLNVLVPPTITANPLSQTGALGNEVIFRVLANGSPPLIYHWRFNGTDLAGATNDYLSLKPIADSQAGPYTVVITNSAGAVTSTPALLAVPRSKSLWQRFKSWF